MWINAHIDLLVFGREVIVRYLCVWINTHLDKYWSKAFITEVVAEVGHMNLV